MPDHDKQAAIDLFLGIKPEYPVPPAWTYTAPPTKVSYREWYRPANLTQLDLSPKELRARLKAYVDAQDAEDPQDLWRRYYRGDRWQTMQVQFAYRLPQQAMLAPIDLYASLRPTARSTVGADVSSLDSSNRPSSLHSPFMSFTERSAQLHPSGLQR